ncbi:ABC transporter substrate-binding protein [Acuticoccus sp. MNP-M23]|uniref:ABC transporter substrate-binding protein n=1 Tax=Acuticoccus sp. MNP-M23 TaxID=3072793 RepID=UPI002815046B|nr:ABC transporter substrate-binding protein [Acuticoccus sp. MNP-M23]WMS40804.1 ABC transporter substrate-binding protein [Acuticoccus sp. MNP-M23]
MKRPVLLAALALPFALALAAPAWSQPETGRIVIGMGLEPPHLDPTAGAAAAIDEILYANVFEGLTRITSDGTVAPALATGWTVAPDGKSVTFGLREGVTFHDGKPFDASVAKFALDRARAEGAENAQPQLFAAISDVTADSPTSLTLTLSRPDANLPYALGWGDAVMVHPDSADTNKQTPVGTGPFQFDRWRRGDRVVLTRNDGYWGPPAHLKRAEFAFVTDATVALAALLAGDVHAFPIFGSPESLPVLETNPKFTVKIGTTEGETILAINAARPPFDDVRVRRAIAAAIDRQALVDGAMYGTATPIGSHMPPHDPAYVDLTGVNPYDPEKAKALLAEAGATDLAVELVLPPTSYARRSGEIIAAELRAVGIDASIRPVEWAEWLSKVFKGKDFDLTVVAHTEPQDINIYARPDYYFHVENARFNAVIDALASESDESARTALLQEAQQLIADDAVNAFLFQLPKVGVWDARIEGLWANSPIQANDLSDVSWHQ